MPLDAAATTVGTPALGATCVETMSPQPASPGRTDRTDEPFSTRSDLLSSEAARQTEEAIHTQMTAGWGPQRAVDVDVPMHAQGVADILAALRGGDDLHEESERLTREKERERMAKLESRVDLLDVRVRQTAREGEAPASSSAAPSEAPYSGNPVEPLLSSPVTKDVKKKVKKTIPLTPANKKGPGLGSQPPDPDAKSKQGIKGIRSPSSPSSCVLEHYEANATTPADPGSPIGLSSDWRGAVVTSDSAKLGAFADTIPLTPSEPRVEIDSLAMRELAIEAGRAVIGAGIVKQSPLLASPSSPSVYSLPVSCSPPVSSSPPPAPAPVLAPSARTGQLALMGQSGQKRKVLGTRARPLSVRPQQVSDADFFTRKPQTGPRLGVGQRVLSRTQRTLSLLLLLLQ